MASVAPDRIAPERGAKGVNDCGFRPSSSTSLGRGRTVSTARRYMKVIFEGNLRISWRARTLFREDGQVRTERDSVPIDQAAVAAQLRAVTVALIRRLRSTASPGDLTWSQESALLRLETGGPQTISQLARAEGTRSQSMGTIVASLEAQGFADRDSGLQRRSAEHHHGQRRGPTRPRRSQGGQAGLAGRTPDRPAQSARARRSRRSRYAAPADRRSHRRHPARWPAVADVLKLWRQIWSSGPVRLWT